MAVFYISPFTATNGTGTFASPFSFSSAARTGMTNGDELRIISAPTSSLFTATVYTGYLSSSIGIFVNGGLISNFVGGDFVYIVEYDTFFRVFSAGGTANTLTLYSASFSQMPVNNTTNTTITLRRVDTTTYPVSSTGTQYFLAGTTTYSNLTITDGWIADGVRVTDGTAKSIIRSSTTTAGCFFEDTSSGNYLTTCSVDMSNTHIFPGVAATASLYTQLNGIGCTYSINQLYSPYYLTDGLRLGSAARPAIDCTYNIKTITNCTPIIGNSYAANCSITIQNAQALYMDLVTGANAIPVMVMVRDSSVTIGNITGNSLQSGITMLYLGNSGWSNTTLTLTGTYDVFTAAGIQGLFYGLGTTGVTLGPNFRVYTGRRVNSYSTVNYRMYGSGSAIRGIAGRMTIPQITNNSTYLTTVTSAIYIPANGLGTTTDYNYQLMGGNVPLQLNLISDGTCASSNYVGLPSTNLLITYTSGASPQEYCSPSNGYAASVAGTSVPLVGLDAAVFRTAGPSLRASLTTFNVNIWGSTANRAWARKAIKIPATSGASKTVAGYFRYSFASGTFTNGDAVMQIILNNTVVTSQSMTTAANGAWEAFSLTFTPSVTGEYNFVWKFRFPAGACSMWIDDVTIT